MKRHEWEFSFTGAQLLAGAEKKLTHHQGRLEFWLRKKGETLAKIRESGIDVHESVAGSAYSNARQQPRVVIDATLQADLTECAEKIEEHRELAESYRGWVQVFGEQRDARQQLHHDDWLYFFGQ